MTDRIVLLNTSTQTADKNFRCILGDARDLSQFADHQFDIVFSNSVIGHVGGLEDQARMAREISRVGKHFFLQTPNHMFPVDWRTLVPFFHFLPNKAQAWCFLHLRVGVYRRARDPKEAEEWSTRVRNLRRHELHTLFPGAAVVEERILGFTKSFMVHNFHNSV
jgi:SAM-dependent methyltransferase